MTKAGLSYPTKNAAAVRVGSKVSSKDLEFLGLGFRVILGLYRVNGKENGSYYVI